MLQKNPESDSVRNQQQRYNESWNEVRGAQLPRQEPGVIGFVKSVQQIDSAPEIEDQATTTPVPRGSDTSESSASAAAMTSP